MVYSSMESGVTCLPSPWASVNADAHGERAREALTQAANKPERMAAVEFAVSITDVLGGVVGPLAFARDSLERAVTTARPGGAPTLQGLHVRGGGSDGGAGSAGVAAEERAPRQATELREEGGSSPVGVTPPTPDTAAAAHDSAALVVQARHRCPTNCTHYT